MRPGLQIVSLSLVLVALAAGCGEDRPEPKGSGVARAPRVRVAVAKAHLGRVESDLSATGVLAAWRTATVSAETSGRVDELLAENGDEVAEGDPLVALDGSRQKISASSARAQLSAAKNDLRLANSDLSQTEDLHGKGSVSDFGLETAQHSLNKANAAVSAARADVRAARREQSDTDIVAPIAGIVANRSVEVGDAVAPGVVVLQVVDISQLRVRVGLTGRQLGRLDESATIDVRVDDLGGKKLTGTFASVSPMANARTGLFDVEYHLHQPSDGALVRAGMVGTAVLPQRTQADGVLVPREALTRRDGTLAVFEIVDGVARLREVWLGAYGDDEVEVLSGLSAGATVATQPLHALADGILVDVADDADDQASQPDQSDRERSK